MAVVHRRLIPAFRLLQSKCKLLQQQQNCRHLFNMAEQVFAIVYREHGDPGKVLEKVTIDLPEKLQQNEILVRMLASPVNPADINMIQGTYAKLPSLPAVAGNEGVGEVIDVGDAVISVKAGDRVIPASSGCGTWRTHSIMLSDNIRKIPKDVPVYSAATAAVNACTAYRLLCDFQRLKQGDTIIQNGCNSGVGYNVIQLSREMGLVSINVLRQRDNFDEIKEHMQSLGANFVISEEQFLGKEMKEFMRNREAPLLALNCVGGKSSTQLMRYLADHGTMVTYGGMSRQPVILPAGSLIFSRKISTGFWMTKWNEEHKGTREQDTMFDVIFNMIQAGKLVLPPIKTVTYDNFLEAVKESMKPYSPKQLLVCINKE